MKPYIKTLHNLPLLLPPPSFTFLNAPFWIAHLIALNQFRWPLKHTILIHYFLPTGMCSSHSLLFVIFYVFFPTKPNVTACFLYREMMYPVEANGLVYTNQIRYNTLPATAMPFNPTMECQTSTFNPIYNTSPVDFLVHQSMKPTIHSVDSSVTHNSDNNNGNNVNYLPPVSSLRKRPREESVVENPMPSQKRCTDPLMFLGQDLSSNVQRHNLDIDRLISNHVSVINY